MLKINNDNETKKKNSTRGTKRKWWLEEYQSKSTEANKKLKKKEKQKIFSSNSSFSLVILINGWNSKFVLKMGGISWFLAMSFFFLEGIGTKKGEKWWCRRCNSWLVS